VKISKPYFLFIFWLSAAFMGALIPIACTNTSSNFNPTSPATPIVLSATATNAFGFTSTPTFTIQATSTPTNTPMVTPITVAAICTPNAPNGLAVSGSKIYVAGGDGTLSIYPIGGGNTTSTLNQFSPTGSSFSSLSGVAIDLTGKLYVLDSGGSETSLGTVYEFDTTHSNNPMTSWNNYNGVTFISPQGIAVDSNNDVYVVDTGNDVVDEFSQSGAATIGLLGYPGGGGNGNFNNPTGIAIGTGGVTVYVSDMDDDLIQEFVSGSFVKQFSTPPESISNAPGIMGIAVNGGGNVFAADYSNGYIEDYNSTSSPVTLISQWGGPSAGPDPGFTGVALNSAATTLYVADYDNNAIYAIAL
jgi:hypothetical protein